MMSLPKKKITKAPYLVLLGFLLAGTLGGTAAGLSIAIRPDSPHQERLVCGWIRGAYPASERASFSMPPELSRLLIAFLDLFTARLPTQAAVKNLAWSPDGRWLASAGRQGHHCLLELWEGVASGRPVCFMSKPRDYTVTSITWCPRLAEEGTRPPSPWLAWAEDAGPTLRLYEVERRRLFILEGHTNFVRCIASSSAGQCLSVGGYQGQEVSLWDLAKRSYTRPFHTRPSACIEAGQWSPSDRWVALLSRRSIFIYAMEQEGYPCIAKLAFPRLCYKPLRLIHQMAWSPSAEERALVVDKKGRLYIAQWGEAGKASPWGELRLTGDDFACSGAAWVAQEEIIARGYDGSLYTGRLKISNQSLELQRLKEGEDDSSPLCSLAHYRPEKGGWRLACGECSGLLIWYG